MAKIIPAILTRDAEEITEKINFLERIPEVAEIQIDFEDGEFVPNHTVLPGDIGIPNTRLSLEAHLMVKKPETYFNQLEELKFQTIFIHFESFKNTHDVLTAVRNAKVLGFKCGVAINPQTEVGVFDSLIGEIDACLIMSVHPGFQGKPFLPESLEKVSFLRKKHKNVIIEVDGGISLANFENVIAHGADRLVVGSGIWQTPDAKQTIYDFLSKLKN